MQRTVENVFHLSRLASLLGPFFVDAEAGSLKLVGTMYGAKMDILEGLRLLRYTRPSCLASHHKLSLGLKGSVALGGGE